MNNQNRKFSLTMACALALLACATPRALAQAQRRQQGRAGGASSTTSPQYYPNGQVGEAMITSDPETHRLIVITDQQTSKYIGQVVTNLDRPEPQVLIKVVFLEVTYNNGSDIGIEGGMQKNINSSTSGSVSNIFGLASQGASPIPPGAGIYQVLGSDFQATLRAIATAGKLEVLSKPSILAQNNQQATITIGQSVPLITNVRFDTFGNAINSVTYQDIGIILRVTPIIKPNGMVQMIVAPETSSLSNQSVPISAGVSAPVIDLRSADTVVVTPNAETVVIGGLMENQKTVTEDKIPFLGDIPWLGNLFKHKVQNNVKTELLIFLTPYIVNQPGELAGLTTRERNNAPLTRKAFTEKELDQFLDGVPTRSQTPAHQERR